MSELIALRILRTVFGGGADISVANPLEVHDPAAVQTLDRVNAMLTLTETGGIVIATGLLTEDNVYVNDAPAGEFYPRKVVIDLSDLAGGEVATIRTYYRIKSGGVAKLKGAPTIFAGVQAEPMKDVDIEPNRFGIQVTVEATVGTVIDWEAHFEE